MSPHAGAHNHAHADARFADLRCDARQRLTACVQLVVAFVLSVFAATAFAQAAPAEQLYAVIFQVTVNPAGKISALDVSQVIDPSSGSTDAVNVPVPAVYVSAVRKHLSKRTYPSQPKQFFTYIFYDPSQPTKADIEAPQVGQP